MKGGAQESCANQSERQFRNALQDHSLFLKLNNSGDRKFYPEKKV